MENQAHGIPRRSNNSYAIRYLGLLKQPDSNSSLELDESDVVGSGDFFGPHPLSESSPIVGDTKNGFMSPPSPASPGGRRREHEFKHQPSGLSAAFAVENRSFLQRNGALDPIFSAAPVPVSRSGSRSEDFSGSRGGSSGRYHQSAPVNIPVWSKVNRRRPNPPNVGDEDDETDDEMLPPHLLVARESARSHVTTFSVFEGVGRTLKGRDLRRVRNAVFQKTGFLD